MKDTQTNHAKNKMIPDGARVTTVGRVPEIVGTAARITHHYVTIQTDDGRQVRVGRTAVARV